jgi:hypothetical protein
VCFRLVEKEEAGLMAEEKAKPDGVDELVFTIR